MGYAEASGVSRCEGFGDFRLGQAGGGFKRNLGCSGAHITRAHTGVGLVEREYLLATMDWGNRRGDRRQLAMAQDACNYRLIDDSLWEDWHIWKDKGPSRTTK